MSVRKMLCASVVFALAVAAHAQAAPEALAKPEAAHAPVAQGGPHEGQTGILTDTQGVDFKPYLDQLSRITQSSWKPLIPKEVDGPVHKSGLVVIRFKILPNGRLEDGAMVMEGRAGDPALDRAAWGAIQTSVYPPLPKDYKGKEIEVRFCFQYNPERDAGPTRKIRQAPHLFGPVGVTLGYNSKL